MCLEQYKVEELVLGCLLVQAELVQLQVLGSTCPHDASCEKRMCLAAIAYVGVCPLLGQYEMVIMKAGKGTQSESDLVNLNCRLICIDSDAP